MKIAYLMFALVMILQPLAQTLQKKGMMQVGAIDSMQKLFSAEVLTKIITSPYVILGVSLSVISLLMWLGAVSNFKLSYLYPLGSISYIVVAIVAYLVFGEKLNIYNWIGIVVIMLGCYLINLE